MATELVPGQGIISLENYIMGDDASLLSVTTEAALYPGLNLLNQLRSKRWRSTTVGSDQYLTFDLGDTYKPRLLSLIDSNLDASKSIALQSCAAADFVSGVKTYTYTTYQQAKGNRALEFFIGEPDSGASALHQYWRVKFFANSQQSGYSYFQCGVIWLGDFLELDIDVDLSMSIEDRAEVESAYNGARYSDVVQTARTIGLTFSLVDLTTLYGIKNSLDAIGSAKHIFVDIFANTENAAQKPHGTLYGTIGTKGVTINQKLQKQGNLEFELDEAIG